MLFNSYVFILVFLPVTLLVFFRLGAVDRRWAAAWLALASLFFYGWWNPPYVALLLVSIVFNFKMGVWVARAREGHLPFGPRFVLVLAIALDLALLGYYKYANFFVENLNAVTGQSWSVGQILLPLGISFFTFTQITFLVDTYKGEAKEYSFVHYLLFVTYFPHLIAGPILHHKEMMPQFAGPSAYRINAEDFAVGLTFFFAGLFKKVVLADGIAPYVEPLFAAAGKGASLTFFESWAGALSYTLQLYYDFSGYSDMAIGLSRMIGIRLPINFNSPYQARNIADLWQRWHMTLTRFLRDYVFHPLGGKRKSHWRRYAALFATMVLAGLWHGAGWTFVIFGALQGALLILNHEWRRRSGKWWGRKREDPGRAELIACRTLTLVVWIAGLMIFRANDMSEAAAILKGMAGWNGFALPQVWLSKLGPLGDFLSGMGVSFGIIAAQETMKAVPWIVPLLLVALFAPNTQAIMARYMTEYKSTDLTLGPFGRFLAWRPHPAWAIGFAVISVVAMLKLTQISTFLYYQF
jgi:D-alanyl-lipoteichoic acid acyltransferase DltB (MBOAT superfamily)